MSEKLRNFETNLKEMRGFYVTRMKKDQATGHYIGIATWIPRNAPLPGTRTSFNNRWSFAREMSTPSIAETPESVVATSRAEEQQSEKRYRAATTEDFSRLVALGKTQPRDALEKKTSFYDPYDSYEL